MSLFEPVEYRTLDKSAWLEGEWKDEPDKAQWYDEITGLPCLIVRGPIGALCGYVGVRPGHPWHGVEYDNVRCSPNEDGDDWPDVHGGLTFSGPCQHSADPAKHICHIPAPGDTDDVWWLGFDCAHSGDFTDMKGTFGFEPRGYDVYRDYSYVRSQVGKLAKQALAAGSGTAETRETAAQCEASQSGAESATPEGSPT